MNKVSNLTSSNAISTCMSDESAHGYVFNRTLVHYEIAQLFIGSWTVQYFTTGPRPTITAGAGADLIGQPVK